MAAVYEVVSYERLQHIEQADVAAVAFHDIAAFDLVHGIVAAFNEDVGLEGAEQIVGSFTGERDDYVDGLERSQEGLALMLRDHRARGALQTADNFISVGGQNEHIAKCPG